MFTTHTIREVVGALAAIVLAFALMCIGYAATAEAASYAYVDNNGDVRSVTADDWMTAINIAPNIHINSGVLLLRASSDFNIVGNNVPSV